MTFDELIDRLHREGGSYTEVVGNADGAIVTKDVLRLAIIDVVIDRELGRPGVATPPPRDPMKPTR
jgi:hypothetical protein